MTAGFPGSAQSGFWSMAAAESVFDAGQLNLQSPQFNAKLRFAFYMSSPRRQDFADVKEQRSKFKTKHGDVYTRFLVVWCRPLSSVQPESLDPGRSSSAEIMSSLWLPVRSSTAAADSDDRISSDSINARKVAVATREGRRSGRRKVNIRPKRKAQGRRHARDSIQTRELATRSTWAIG